MNRPFSLKIAVVDFIPHSLLPLLKHHKLLAFEPYAGPGQEERGEERRRQGRSNTIKIILHSMRVRQEISRKGILDLLIFYFQI